MRAEGARRLLRRTLGVGVLSAALSGWMLAPSIAAAKHESSHASAPSSTTQTTPEASSGQSQTSPSGGGSTAGQTTTGGGTTQAGTTPPPPAKPTDRKRQDHSAGGSGSSSGKGSDGESQGQGGSSGSGNTGTGTGTGEHHSGTHRGRRGSHGGADESAAGAPSGAGAGEGQGGEGQSGEGQGGAAGQQSAPSAVVPPIVKKCHTKACREKEAAKKLKEKHEREAREEKEKLEKQKEEKENQEEKEATERKEHETQKESGHGGGSHESVAATASTTASSATSQSGASSLPPSVSLLPSIVRESRVSTSGGGHGRGSSGGAHRRTLEGAEGELAAGAAVGTSSGLAGLSAAGSGSGGGNPSGNKPKPPPHKPAELQLITTVTKIINVVPGFVQAIIAALAALALAFAVNSRMAARRARRLARQRRELLDDVGLLQAALLPALPDHVGAVGTSAAYSPASGPAAGGDFYDLFTLSDGRIGVIVGDVSGHGRKALPHTTLVRFTLRAYLEAGLSPRGALQTAAPVLERQLSEGFVTVALASYDPAQRTLTYACAGHPPPLVLGTDGPDEELQALEPVIACSAPPIGAGQPTGTRQTVVSLPGRALVCFYTDGIVEARVRGSLYGVHRLARTLAELRPEEDGAASLLERVAREADRRPDDMAACLLTLGGEEQLPRILLDELELERHENARERAERFLSAAGVGSLQIARATAALEGSLGRGGGVMLEVHAHAEEPEVSLRESNVAPLRPPTSSERRPREATG